MRIFVTGANGFVGKHLVARLSERGHRVYACMRDKKHAFAHPVVNVYADVNDKAALREAIASAKPDGVFHLAAQSEVGEAWMNPMDTLLANAGGTISMIEAVRLEAPGAKLVTVGSSEEYGWAGKEGEPLTEERACLPQNPYATSKLAAGQLALQLAGRYEINVIHARPFNHFGPGQREGFVISDFASQVAKIEAGLSPPVIKIGNLSAMRDFTDVRDIVEAYALLIETEIRSGVYNICSGKPVEIKKILDDLISRSSIAIEVRPDPSRIRKSEVPLFIGSSEKLFQATGWRPCRNFEESLLETLDWWREHVST